jgi:hypothetical protein
VYTVAFARGGLGWGNLRNNGDSITCVYTVAPFRRGLGRGFWHWCQLNVHVSLRSPTASAITQHYQGFCWVSLSLNLF